MDGVDILWTAVHDGKLVKAGRVAGLTALHGCRSLVLKITARTMDYVQKIFEQEQVARAAELGLGIKSLTRLKLSQEIQKAGTMQAS
jgi:hypothetical protein